MRKIILVVAAFFLMGCNGEARARMWANVWHAADAIERGVEPAAVTPSLKEIAVKGAQNEGYTIQGAR